MTTLTTASHELFMDLARTAGDWSGTPLVELTREERGNLTDLKRHGLLSTMESDGCVFAYFTTAGGEYAAEHGVELLDEWLA